MRPKSRRLPKSTGETDPVRAFPPEVRRKLGSYVYLYIDPTSGEPFYIGKGLSNRALAHLDDETECRKTERIAEIHARGQEPLIEILRYGLTNEQAFLVEAAAIDLLGISTLTNAIRGAHSGTFGRISLREILIRLAARRAKIKHRVILFTINQLYRSDMSEEELYEATRGVWDVGPAHARQAKYAMAVYQGIIREVYFIKAWHPAGTQSYRTRDDWRGYPERWEFEGGIADNVVRQQYIDKSVRSLVGQKPFRYVNC